MDYRIFHVCIYVNACDCTRGSTDAFGEYALKVDSGRKIAFTAPRYPTCLRDVPMLYQLSYISTSQLNKSLKKKKKKKKKTSSVHYKQQSNYVRD